MAIAMTFALGLTTASARVADHGLSQRLRAERSRSATLQAMIVAQRSESAAVAQRLAALEQRLDNTPDPAKIAATVKGSVFTVDAYSDIGSGFVFGDQSAVITNYHVVDVVWRSGRRTVRLHRGNQEFAGQVTQVNEAFDLALIHVDGTFPQLPKASVVPAVGDPIIVVGSPLGLDGTVSTGIVSGLRNDGPQHFVQFSAPISPGSSGGPVVNERGEVIGVTEMKAFETGAEGLSFAIPIEQVCSTLLSC